MSLIFSPFSVHLSTQFLKVKHNNSIPRSLILFLFSSSLPKESNVVLFSHLGAAGALTAMIIKRLGYAAKYWSLLFTINGGLTGMVQHIS